MLCFGLKSKRNMGLLGCTSPPRVAQEDSKSVSLYIHDIDACWKSCCQGITSQCEIRRGNGSVKANAPASCTLVGSEANALLAEVVNAPDISLLNESAH